MFVVFLNDGDIVLVVVIGVEIGLIVLSVGQHDENHVTIVELTQ